VHHHVLRIQLFLDHATALGRFFRVIVEVGLLLPLTGAALEKRHLY